MGLDGAGHLEELAGDTQGLGELRRGLAVGADLGCGRRRVAAWALIFMATLISRPSRTRSTGTITTATSSRKRPQASRNASLGTKASTLMGSTPAPARR